jgi:hypothetical protein
VFAGVGDGARVGSTGESGVGRGIDEARVIAGLSHELMGINKCYTRYHNQVPRVGLRDKSRDWKTCHGSSTHYMEMLSRGEARIRTRVSGLIGRCLILLDDLTDIMSPSPCKS